MENEKETSQNDMNDKEDTTPRNVGKFDKAFKLSAAGGFTQLQIAAACQVSLTTITRWKKTTLWQNKFAAESPKRYDTSHDERKADIILNHLIQKLALRDLKQLCIVLKENNWTQLDADLRNEIEDACTLHEFSVLQFISGLRFEDVLTPEED